MKKSAPPLLSDAPRGGTATAEFGGLHADEWSALLAVASEGSFVAAGSLLKRDPSVVSKRITSLEKRLAVRMLERSTRRVRLTAAGAQFAEKILQARTLISDAEQEASQHAAVVTGRLRLSFPATLGRLWLAPLVPEFLSRYPSLHVEVDYSERYSDLIAEGIDAAVRIGTMADSRLVAKPLATHRRILAASPDYLARYGRPRAPADLARHNCLEFDRLLDFPQWQLSNGKRTVRVQAQGTLCSNDSSALLEAARAGVGILGAGDWLMSRDLEAGALVRVLPAWELGSSGGIYLVRPSARFTPAKTRAFSDWISEKFSPHLPWSGAKPAKRHKQSTSGST